MAKAMGKLGAGAALMVDKLLNPQVPWEEVLQSSLTRALSGDESDWSRVDIPSMMKGYPFIMPARKSTCAGTVVCIMDTSGSVSVDEAAQYLTEVKAICENANPETVHLLWTNTSVDAVHTFEDDIPGELDSLMAECMKTGRLPGRSGGTDMVAAFDFVNDNELCPDVIAVFTDGYTPYPDEIPCDTVWVVSTNAHVPEGVGGVIRVCG